MLDTVEGDPYVVLGITTDADDHAIAMAHRKLARQHHPDIAGEDATSRMTRINAAFDAIRTAERRAEYERGRPPGRPAGSVLNFGRHVGWSLGEIARVDPGYLVWLAERREGARYRAEIDALLARVGYQRPTERDERVSPWQRAARFR
jgi:molecular chaperone DnaJ